MQVVASLAAPQCGDPILQGKGSLGWGPGQAACCLYLLLAQVSLLLVASCPRVPGLSVGQSWGCCLLSLAVVLGSESWPRYRLLGAGAGVQPHKPQLLGRVRKQSLGSDRWLCAHPGFSVWRLSLRGPQRCL